jgi:hypothetical protein
MGNAGIASRKVKTLDFKQNLEISRRWERSWGGQEIWNQRKRLFSSRNPLKRLKTAKRIVGKAWRFQAKNLEMFGVDLENLARNLQRRTGVFPARRRQKA